MNQLQRASVRRKIVYVAAILVLFSLTLFWRGKLTVPFGNPLRKADQAPTALNRTADRLARGSVRSQAERLELRELDQGDPEIAASAARLSLVGSRGLVVSGLWWAAIKKQARHEFHEFELLARLVSRLQPNFITPWIYQGWNISYNVSVENDKLGDMYFYIARGIQLLAEGDRLNTKVDRTDPEPDDRRKRRIGSPDIRREIGFFYQNKFGVSDKVQTLRCLMQLSCVRPADRKPDSFLIPGQGVDAEQFRRFCEQNPQLVRRLQARLNCKYPEQVIDFLRDNEGVPTLYRNDTELAEAADQFPVLPPRFPQGEGEEGVREYMVSETGVPSREMNDTFDAFLAGRAWFAYGLTVVPPPMTDEFGDPIPWASPRPGEYDQFRYRMPRSPALIIYRLYPARAQSYLAERLTKEGWFDEATTWNPDDQAGLSQSWFPRFAPDGTPVEVRLATKTSSRIEWGRAWELWNRLGQQNGLVLSPDKRQQLLVRAGGMPSSLPPDYTKEEAESLGLDPRRLDAQRALVFFDQNRSVTNFPYFLESSLAERDQVTVDARKLLWEAEQAELGAQSLRATRLYTQALAKWREVLLKFPRFHRTERSERTEEETFEYEIKLVNLLKGDGAVLARVDRVAAASRGLFPSLPDQVRDDYIQAVAEDEANARVAAYLLVHTYPRQQLLPDSPERKALDQMKQIADRIVGPRLYPGAALAGDAAVEALTPRQMADAMEQAARQVLDGEDYWWMKEFKLKPVQKDFIGNYEREAYWVAPDIRDTVKSRLGLVRRAPPSEEQLPVAPPEGPPGS